MSEDSVMQLELNLDPSGTTIRIALRNGICEHQRCHCGGVFGEVSSSIYFSGLNVGVCQSCKKVFYFYE